MVEPEDDEKPVIMNQVLLRSDVSLGDFYNAKTNKYLPGMSLWTPKDIKENSYEHYIGSTKYKFSEGKTTSSRVDSMDISAELKLSFLSKF